MGSTVEASVAYAHNLTKEYASGPHRVRALDNVSVTFRRGELTAVMGPSGSGKSTLMHCMAGLDSPTSGKVVVDGSEITEMSQRQLTRLRRDRLGFIFQSFNLIPTLTAAENITLPMDVARRRVDRRWFDRVVAAVGLHGRLGHRPAELSGGQQQRVACARALLARPAVVFADEPTGNLDSKAANDVLTFLRRSTDELGQSVIMVTHDPRAAAFAHRAIFLADGRLLGEIYRPTQEAVLRAFASITPTPWPAAAQ